MMNTASRLRATEASRDSASGSHRLDWPGRPAPAGLPPRQPTPQTRPAHPRRPVADPV